MSCRVAIQLALVRLAAHVPVRFSRGKFSPTSLVQKGQPMSRYALPKSVRSWSILSESGYDSQRNGHVKHTIVGPEYGVCDHEASKTVQSLAKYAERMHRKGVQIKLLNLTIRKI